jgi:hypothetical protein
MPGRVRKYNKNGEFLALHSQGLSDWRIAKICKCHDSIVWQWRKKAGLPAHKNPPLPRPPVDFNTYFNFREYTEILDKAVEETGVSIHTLEGRKLRDWAFVRFERAFMMEGMK